MENSGNLGSEMPQFLLPDVYDQIIDSKTLEEDVLVVMFICGHCPYVQAIEKRLIALSKHFEYESVKLIGICSNNSIDYPEDSKESLKLRVESLGIPFSYLIDESQEVAKSFNAVCTPDIFVFDKNRKLAYHGQLDDNWKSESEVKREDLKMAITALIDNRSIDIEQIPTMGCSIKWK